MSQLTPIVKLPPPTLRQRLESPAFRAQLAKALPKHLTPDRQIRVACTAIMRAPKLEDCDQVSFFNSMLTLSQFGLEPDGRRAHLIPFENRKRGVVECQLIIDYKGLAELAMRSGLVATLHADVVKDGDLFEYNMGRLTSHVPWFLRRDADKPAEAGAIYAAYALAVMKDGTAKCEVMSLDEVNAIRARSRAGQSGPWVTDFNEMAKKTAFRRLSKWLPLSPEFRDAVEVDDDAELDRMPRATPVDDKPIFVSPPAQAEPEAVQPDEDQVPGLEVAPARATPAPAPAPAPEAKPAPVNHLRGVSGLLKTAGIEESKAVAFAHKFMGVDESLSNLAEVNELQPGALAELFDNWATYGPRIKAWQR